jgi:YD repeat-containing protein
MRFDTFPGSLAAFAAALVVAVLACDVAHAQSPFKPGSAKSGRSLDSAMPNEAVDPFSGTLSIVETDLVLPGNAGLDVRVQRVYTSAIYPGYQTGDLTIEEDSWAGIGWKLHFGRVINPDATTSGTTQIEMGDGGRQALYTTPIAPGWTTKDFGLYDRSTHTLKLPNGIVYEFGHVVTLGGSLGTVRYVTVIRDPYDNRLEFSYFSAPGPVDGVSLIHQDLGGGQVRNITFTYDATHKALATMSYDAKTWTYTQQAAGPAGYSTLERAQSPVGLGTEYDYSWPGSGQPGHELTVLRTAGGGTVTYTYGDVVQHAGAVTNTGRGVVTKVLGGPYVTPGTWTYVYGTGPNQDQTRVTCPCGITTYTFNGIGTSGTFSGWKAGTLAERTLEHQSVLVEREVLTWQSSEAISPDPTLGPGGIWSDGDVYRALLATRTVTRGSRSWITTHEYHTGLGNFNDYGRPWRTIEDGELDRTMTRTFRAAGLTPYIIPPVVKEEITPNGFEVNMDYAQATGFLVARTLHQFVPNSPIYNYEAWANGNVKAVIDPIGNRTDFLYAWGRVSKVTTPNVTTDYGVSPDSTVAWEETGGLRTNYEYDGAFRLFRVKPPSQAPQVSTWTEYTYDNIGAGFVTVTRAPSVLTSYVDGFGRVRGTVDQANVKTRVDRDACGRTTFQSYPYTTGTGSTGVGTTYDALQRPLTVTEGVGTTNPTTTSYAYPAGSVVIIDAKNRATTYEYSAFGDPGDARLFMVTDADNKLTRYGYDAFGNLSRVNGPNATGAIGSLPERTWTYDHRNYLQIDSQPERGVTTYLTDAAGNVREISDASGTTLLYYDGNNRLSKRDAPGTADDLEIHYDTAGHVDQMASPTFASPTARTTYGFDPAGRVSWRTDLVNGYTFNSSYTYLANDALDEMTYPTAKKAKYTYDALGRLSTVAYNGSTFANTFVYDGETGLLWKYNTGPVTHQTTFDAKQRVSRITSGTSGLDLTYAYDEASQVAGITDPRPGMSQTFNYDAVGRMWAADGPYGALRWSYDPAGNRLTETRGSITTYNYDAPTQRLLSTSGAIVESFTYDPVGRLKTDGRGTYDYNARGLLTAVTNTSAGLSASYSYDPAGLRSARTVNGQTTYSARSAGGEVLSEFVSACGTLTWARDLVSAGGRSLGAVRASTTTPAVAMTAATATVSEAQTSVQVGVRLTTPGGATLACAVTVAYETTTGTATLGGDVTRVGGTLKFDSGTASGTVLNITVPLLPDATNEPLETFTVLLSSATGATLASPAGQTVTIDDDDLAPAMAVEAPTAGATVRTPFTVSGWAIDESVTTGTGIDYISVHATPTGGSFIPLGSATYGQARPDIATLYNHSRFTNSGFTYTAHLPPGPYVVTVYAGNAATGWCCQAKEVPVTVAPANPQMWLESPATGANLAQPFTMSGWAIDAGTSSGTGVARVEVLAYPNPGSGAPAINLGDAAYGDPRPYVQQAYQAYGTGFTNSGFLKEVRGLTPGVYRLVAQALSTVTGTFNQFREITVTVNANPLMWVEQPGTGTSVNQSFTISGWAADLAAASGSGVNTVHIWAYPNPGSGQAPIWVGTPTYGTPRSDVAAIYGTQFTNSGFSMTATLPPGVYQLYIAAYSLVANGFNQAQNVTVTVATSQPVMSIDTPGTGWWVNQPFHIGGWAIDLGAPSGTGVDAVHIHAIANGGAGAWTFLGAATYGGARPDVGAYYGTQFTNSAYGLNASGLAPGYYQINVYQHSTVSGLWTQQTIFVTIP